MPTAASGSGGPPTGTQLSSTIELYDQTTAHMQPLPGADVSIGSATAKSDGAGRYLFRHLASGSYAVTVTYNGKTWTRTVQLSAMPDIESGVDIMVTQPLPPATTPVPVPAATPTLKEQRLMRENRHREPKS